MSNDWEIVQEKAFTAWVNGVLDKAGESVTDITTDFADGIKLVHFLELLSGKKVGKKIDAEKKAEIYRIQNVFLALQFAEQQMGVKAEGVSAEDFVKGNRKLVLGFLWTLYRKYRIAVIKEGDKSSEEGLLQWCKNVTSDYGGVDIKSFKTGFRDGNAFLALAHKYDPAAFDFDAFNNETPEMRLEKAFEIAEKSIKIPKLLDVGEVMKGTADERSLILYTSLFFHAYSAQAQAQALEEEKAKLGNLESSLSSAHKSKEDLLRQLEDLEKAKADLTETNTTKDGQIQELTEENTKLKGEVTELKGKGEELQTNLTTLDTKSKAEHEDLSGQITQNKQKITELEGTITELEGQIKDIKSRLEASEKENEDLKEKLKQKEEAMESQRVKLELEKAELNGKLSDAQKQFESGTADLGQEMKDKLRQKDEETDGKLKQKDEETDGKLKQKDEERESQRVKLELEKGELTNKLKEAYAMVEEERKRADAEFSALLLLRQQFDQHVLDMHRWRKLLEVDNIADFPVEIKPPLEDELAKQGAFHAQVGLLRGKLEDETKDIHKYLHDKEEFEKTRLKVDKKR